MLPIEEEFARLRAEFVSTVSQKKILILEALVTDGILNGLEK